MMGTPRSLRGYPGQGTAESAGLVHGGRLTGALLNEQAAWTRLSRGNNRKAFVARLYAQRHLADRGPLRGTRIDHRLR
ncbi:hypothetical protein [Mycobacterium leprae]|nr:hypothetical protein [Mycobacterium leprae]